MTKKKAGRKFGSRQVVIDGKVRIVPEGSPELARARLEALEKERQALLLVAQGASRKGAA